MKHVLFQVLQKRAANTVDDAFWDTCRTGRVHDVKRVIELDLGKLERRIFSGEILPAYCSTDVINPEIPTRKSCDYGAFNAVDGFENAFDWFKAIMPLAVVKIPVCAKQYFRLDLSEAIYNSINAEVGGT